MTAHCNRPEGILPLHPAGPAAMPVPQSDPPPRGGLGFSLQGRE